MNRNRLEIPAKRVIEGVRAEIRQHVARRGEKIVALDDDPTGCQTVHNVRLLLDWREPLVSQAVKEEASLFYILHNSRAKGGGEAVRINEEIIARLLAHVSKEKLRIISRSDSTLRGHFWPEVSTLMKSLSPIDGLLVVPYFKEGGRYTYQDTHYVAQGDVWIPAHETEFADDPVFGFKSGHLPTWIEEKSGGFWKASEVLSVSIEDIRLGGLEAVYGKLMQAEKQRPIVVNALSDEDLEVLVLALCKAEEAGKRYLYRTAASFVKIRAGLEEKPILQPRGGSSRKGVIIAGSYVKKTTEQLRALEANNDIPSTELLISKILESYDEYLRKCRQEIEDYLNGGQSVLLFTERNYALSGKSKAEQLQAGRSIAHFQADLVGGLTAVPDFIIAKGGITSHTVAHRGLKLRAVKVVGQIAPGIPLWECGQDSKFPGMPYIVFPGNVGAVETLSHVYQKFQYVD